MHEELNMPFALITIGLMIVVTALNNTWRQFGSQVYKDVFSESGGFLYWVAALVIVGFVGYIPQLRKPADAFLVLILVAMLFKNGGVFQKLQQGLQSGAGGSTGSGTATGASSASTPFGSTGLNLPIFGSMIGDSETLTTPAPAPAGQSVPLGMGGIGAA